MLELVLINNTLQIDVQIIVHNLYQVSVQYFLFTFILSMNVLIHSWLLMSYVEFCEIVFEFNLVSLRK